MRLGDADLMHEYDDRVGTRDRYPSVGCGHGDTVNGVEVDRLDAVDAAGSGGKVGPLDVGIIVVIGTTGDEDEGDQRDPWAQGARQGMQHL